MAQHTRVRRAGEGWRLPYRWRTSDPSATTSIKERGCAIMTCDLRKGFWCMRGVPGQQEPTWKAVFLLDTPTALPLAGAALQLAPVYYSTGTRIERRCGPADAIPPRTSIACPFSPGFGHHERQGVWLLAPRFQLLTHRPGPWPQGYQANALLQTEA